MRRAPRVMSNAKRRRINVERNEATCPPDSVWLEANDTKIWLHEGFRLQGSLPQKSRVICNGVVHTVTAFHAGSITLEDGQGSYTVPTEFAKESFRLAYARTIFSAQSQTLHGTIGIHDMDSIVATERHLLTAISRGTSYDKIRVE